MDKTISHISKEVYFRHHGSCFVPALLAVIYHKQQRETDFKLETEKIVLGTDDPLWCLPTIPFCGGFLI